MSDPSAYLEWLAPALRWLEENWPEEQTWAEVRPSFLYQVGLDENALHAPEYRVLELVDQHLEYGVDPAAARHTLLDEGERWTLLAQSVDQADQESAAVGGGADEAPQTGGTGEPQWVEGHGWMRFDESVGEWVLVDGDASGTTGAAQSAGAGEPQWVEGHGWMRYDESVGEWVLVDGGEADTPGEPPAAQLPEEDQLAVTQAAASLAPLLADVLGELDADPDVDLATLSPEDVQEILSEALAESSATR